MGIQTLHEATTTPIVVNDGVFEITAITPGTGSSGVYTAEMLAEYGPAAFPKGSKNFFNHPESWQGPGSRDPRDQWGVLIEDAYPAEDGSLKAKVKVLKNWRTVVEALAEEGQADLSIYASGEVSEDGIVQSLTAERTNGIDMVAFPGRPGSRITQKMYESARAGSDKPGVTSAQDKKEGTHMDEELKDLRKAVEALTTALTTFISESTTKVKADVKAEADAEAVDNAVKEALATYDEKVQAIEAAELLPSQAKSLREQAKGGADVAPLIESAKAIVEEARKTLAEAAKGDTFLSEGAGNDTDYSMGEFGGSF